jgi:hypothetical protein
MNVPQKKTGFVEINSPAAVREAKTLIRYTMNFGIYTASTVPDVIKTIIATMTDIPTVELTVTSLPACRTGWHTWDTKPLTRW